MLVVVTGNHTDLVFSPWQKLHSVTDVIKDTIATAVTLWLAKKNSVPTIGVTSAARGIVNVNGVTP